MLETPEGKRCLVQLGRAVIQQWVRSKTHRFGGNPNHMAAYVDHFLSALRQGFPQVTVIHLGGPDILACTRRMTPRPGFTWDGNLHAYRPNKAVGLYFNMSVSKSKLAARASELIISSELLIWLELLPSCGRRARRLHHRQTSDKPVRS